MKKLTLIAALSMMFLTLAASSASAQYAYGLSKISYNSGTKEVYGYSRTSLDYTAGVYYDPIVKGFLYNQYSNYPLQSGSSRGLANTLAAEVGTSIVSTPSTRYDVISDHYVITCCSVTVTVCNYYGFAPGCGYDPFGFSYFTSGNFGGFFNPKFPVSLLRGRRIL